MGKEKMTPLLFYKGAYGVIYALSMMVKLTFYIFICILHEWVCRCICQGVPGTCGNQGLMSEVIVNHDVPCCLRQDLSRNLESH